MATLIEMPVRNLPSPAGRNDQVHGDEGCLPSGWCAQCKAVVGDVRDCIICERAVCEGHSALCTKCGDVFCEQHADKFGLIDGGVCKSCVEDAA